MSTTVISESFNINGVLTDVTSVVLSDPTGTFGVRRLDTGATVVAANTALNHDGTGQYSYSFADPAPGLSYDYWITFVYNGATYRFEKQQSEAAASANCYLAISDADAIAATLLASMLPNYNAANSSNKLLALQQATLDLDLATRWQGRKFCYMQTLEFPRLLQDPGVRFGPWGIGWYGQIESGGFGSDVADWDWTNQVAIVPPKVLTAIVFQADYVLGGGMEARLDDIHSGVRGQSTGGASENYDATAPGAKTSLCRRAWKLVERYQLMTGRMY